MRTMNPPPKPSAKASGIGEQQSAIRLRLAAEAAITSKSALAKQRRSHRPTAL